MSADELYAQVGSASLFDIQTGDVRYRYAGYILQRVVSVEGDFMLNCIHGVNNGMVFGENIRVSGNTEIEQVKAE